MKDEAVYADLIGQHLSGNSSREESAKLMAWVEASAANRAFFEEMERIWRDAEQYQETPFEANMDEAWAKIAAQTPLNNQANRPTAKVVKMRHWRKMTSIAAAILVLIGIGWWYANQPADVIYQEVAVRTDQNEQLKYTLPDSSIVWLNENSQIAFVENFEKRTIRLVGEAFFEVQRMEDSPFEIFSGDAKTRVLGTSFNVRAYPQEDVIEVTVATGTVEFSKKEESAEKVILTKGNSGILKKAEEKAMKVTKGFSNAITWKTEQYQFQNFNDVLLSIERYFEVDIEVENKAILNCNFTNAGKLSELNLDILKELIEFQTNNSIQLEQRGERYFLKGEGCQK